MRPISGSAPTLRLHQTWHPQLKIWSHLLHSPFSTALATSPPPILTGASLTTSSDSTDSPSQFSAAMCPPAGPGSTLEPAGPSSFIVRVTSGGARLGVITTPHGDIQTPSSLLYTRLGSPMHLVPDMADKLREKGQVLQLNAMHLCGPLPF